MTISSNIKYLVDTNILIYAFDRSSPFHVSAREIIVEVIKKSKGILVAQQNLIEFCNVLHRQYDIPVKEVAKDAENIMRDFGVIAPLSTTFHLFLSLLENNQHLYPFDLYLAATMLDNKITHIITANERDFAFIDGIVVHNPYK